MSTTSIAHDIGMYPIVIVRGFRDRPKCVRLIELRDDIAVVAGADVERALGIPRDDVFSFDEDTYARLFTAFETSDTTALRRLWAKLDHYQSD